MTFWWGPHMGGWGYALMSISMVLFWGLVVFGVLALVRYLTRGDGTSARRPTAEDVLAERFARGEIDEQEYRSRTSVLRGRPQPTGGRER